MNVARLGTDSIACQQQCAGVSIMNNATWRIVAEITGILALVASLVFVGIETQNSTKQAKLTTQALEIASYQELISSILEMNASSLVEPEVAALMFKAYRTDEELTDLESFRFSRAIFARFRLGDMAYFQYERGAIDEKRLRSVLKVLNLGNLRVREFWGKYKSNFVGSYSIFIDQLLSESQLDSANPDAVDQ